MTEFTFVYLTFPSVGEATHVGRVLLDERLAACVNILSPVQSLYNWNGTVEENTEIVMIAKSRSALFDALSARVKALHSYTNPCIVALPISQGAPDFLQWIASTTKPQP